MLPAVEGHAEGFEPAHDLRGASGEIRHGIRICQIHAAAHGILKMLLRGVPLAHGIERCIDAALGKDGLRTLRGLQGDQVTGNARRTKRHSSRKPRQSCTDDMDSLHVRPPFRSHSSGYNRSQTQCR